MPEKTLLVIEDDGVVRESLKDTLVIGGYGVVAVKSGEEGLEALKKRTYGVILSDLVMPGISGVDVVRSAKRTAPDTVCIIFTAHASVETAIDAMRAGAFTYLKKPVDKDELLVTLEKAFEVYGLRTQNNRLKSELKKDHVAAILGTSQGMQDVRSRIEKVADTDSTVLVTGESGTGKELVARALHYASSRGNCPFIPINCAAIPEDLLESELFGHEKGAFTGAIATKIGRFESADKGTVFLDEIGDMSLALQVKILRVLQEKSFVRVGGSVPIHVDVRVVAATNHELEKAVEEKKFRKDLYYRLNVIPVHLPPLRERRDDIAVLAAHFIDKIARQKKKTIKGIAPDALKLLEAWDWPGNVRELENLVERFIVLKDTDGYVTVKDLPTRIRESDKAAFPYMSSSSLLSGKIDFNSAVDSFERELIVSALSRVKGVKKKAAEYLGLNRTTLIEKMKRKGLISKGDVLNDT